MIKHLPYLTFIRASQVSHRAHEAWILESAPEVLATIHTIPVPPIDQLPGNLAEAKWELFWTSPS